MKKRVAKAIDGALLAVIAVMLAVAGNAAAHSVRGGNDDAHAGHAAMSDIAKPAEVAADIELHDLELLDQDGRRVRFRSDVIADKFIFLSVMYTTCTTACPVTSAIFAQLQKRLGPRVGDDVRLVSLSVDPATDTPRRLKQQAKKFNAGPGWVWLTGGKRSMDIVLDGIGAYTTNFRDHPTVVLVGDGRTNAWRRFFGFPAPDKLLAALDELQAGRVPGHDATAHQ
jgi:protein SCO1/2